MPTIQIQLSLNLGEDTCQAIAEILASALKLVPPEKRPMQNGDHGVGAIAPVMTNVKVRQSVATTSPEVQSSTPRNVSNVDQPSADKPVLVDTRTAAKMLGISDRHLYRLRDTGRVPPPLKMGGAVRWNVENLRKWIDSGCPRSRR